MSWSMSLTRRVARFSMLACDFLTYLIIKGLQQLNIKVTEYRAVLGVDDHSVMLSQEGLDGVIESRKRDQGAVFAVAKWMADSWKELIMERSPPARCLLRTVDLEVSTCCKVELVGING